MSEITKLLASLSKDINKENRGSGGPPSVDVSDEESPDTHMSTTLSIPDSFRSSIDNPNSTEAFRISIDNALIKSLEFSLRSE
jgi:hypothetical protein